MELCSSSEAASRAANQKFPKIVLKQVLHYCVHWTFPLVPIPKEINPVHSIPSYLPEIIFNIITLPASWFPGGLSPFCITLYYLICVFILSIHAIFPSISSFLAR
jgi:hypothetical protein